MWAQRDIDCLQKGKGKSILYFVVDFFTTFRHNAGMPNAHAKKPSGYRIRISSLSHRAG
jgi:hypothetical protein